MATRIFFVLLPSLVLSSAAWSQTFPSQTQALPTRQGCVGCYGTDPVPVDPKSFVFLHDVGSDSSGNLQIEDYGAIPLGAFAGAADVASLSNQVSHLKRKAVKGAALAGATDMQGPAPGKDNRVGGLITTYDGEAAGGVTFSHRAGSFDLGGAVAFAKGEHMAKAGAGFSF